MEFNGFTYDELKTTLLAENQNVVFGEKIKPHTTKKIAYVAKYVEEWLFVITNVSQYIFFIDIMSNAGVYKNSYLSTSIEVLNVFVKYAKKHKDKQFFLLANDYDGDKVSTMKKIYQLYQEEFDKLRLTNIKMNVDCEDACDYLSKVNAKYHLEYVKGIKKSILLYVDPYNFINKRLAFSVEDFISKNYCELVLNFYCNDYSRNVSNNKAKDHQKEIKELIKDFCKLDENKNISAIDLRNHFTNILLKNTKMKYYYFVSVKNEKNAPLYYLIFLTPNIRGLEKVKEATWNILSYHEEYCSTYKERDPNQLNLFNETPEDEAFDGALYKLEQIFKQYNGRELSFEEIEVICLQKTFMKSTHVISRVIKPLINANKMIKQGNVGKANFREDKYLINLR